MLKHRLVSHFTAPGKPSLILFGIEEPGIAVFKKFCLAFLHYFYLFILVAHYSFFFFFFFAFQLYEAWGFRANEESGHC